MRIYAIGDVHGQLEMLLQCHALIEEDRRTTKDADAPVVHLGDYVDRGPQSSAVIQFLLDGVNGAKPWVCLKGNHDRMMSLYLEEERKEDPQLRVDFAWLHPNLGGVQTLESYGISDPESVFPDALHAMARDAVPSDHVSFLAKLPTSYATDDLFFCHAGIRPGDALDAQSEDDLIWIRGEFHRDRRDHGKLIVHGHTPVTNATHYGNRVNLDTGAGYGRPITVAVFEGRDCWRLTNAGRVPLIPQRSVW